MYWRGVWVLAAVVCAVLAADDSYVTWTDSAESGSEEYGQFRGPKDTNCSCGWTNKDSGRIVGGREAFVNEFPYMVGLGYMSPRGSAVSAFCGASIITPRHVLTAAHCTFQDHGEKLGVVVGEHDTSRRDETKHTKVYAISKIIEHEGWSLQTFQNDVAIVITEKEIEFNQYVGPVCLPSPNMPSLVGKHIRVTGWGNTKGNGEESERLLKVRPKVIDLKFCKEKYPHKPIRMNPNTQLCTYSYRKDSCQGDSGGPVVWLDPETNRYTQVGVVSFGAGCATRIPGVNTDVSHFLGWIQKTVRESIPSSYRTCSKRG
uniref:Trypsin-like protease n=1 Tax=Ranatra unicolor TaxID=500709 RepID=B8PWQ7_9HEMI|nr:trypsin-like protease [Ranatra unicolor]